ncbi:MAG TPA: CsbD family protein [Chloroflexota bacterium]|nr:CsbD family protein [Chloroflexota bacterium]
MAGTKDEAMGGMKQGIGKMTGDEALEAEGTTQKKSGRAKRRTAGAAHEVKGNVKKAAGKVLDSPTLKAEGEADKARGKVERS